MKITDTNGNERECTKVSLDKDYPGYVKADFKSKVRKDYTHSEWFPVDEFIKLNPKHKGVVKGKHAPIEEDYGIVTSSGNLFIKDTSKNWKKNIYAGFPLWISRGTGEGQQKTVMKNTKNTLYVDKEWKIKPDKTSQYVLSRNVQDNIEAQGNTLPDLASKKMMEDLVKKAKKGTKLVN